MTKGLWINLWLFSSLLLLVAVACDSNTSRDAIAQSGESTSSILSRSSEASSKTSFLPSSGDSNAINVYGKGTASASPDIVLVTLGIEAREDSVLEARGRAAEAMTKLFAVLQQAGIDDQDIQTRTFSITPQYTWREKRDEEGNRINEQVPAGFIVSNQVVVLLRDIAKTGHVIDSIAVAGGDLTRVRGVQFAIDDPSAIEAQAREAAVLEGMKKARHYAETAGLNLGALLTINESSTTVPGPKSLGQDRSLMMLAESTTPVAGGELEVQVTLQMSFAISGQ